MTDEEFVKTLTEKRISKWSFFRTISNMTPQELETCGYRGKTNAEALLDAFRRAYAEIEAMMRKHERENPGR